MKLTFFISRTKQIYPEKAILHLVLFKILLMPAVICKQRFLHENEIGQYFQNYKYQDVNHDHFRKCLQASRNINTTLRQPMHVSRVVQFLATFYV